MLRPLAARRMLLTTLFLATGACMHRKPAQARPASTNATTPAAPATPTPRTAQRPRSDLTDANIMAILLAANNTGISYARLAPSRSRSLPVRDFAARAARDDDSLNQAVTDLINRLALNPVDSKTSLAFRDESAAKRELLRPLDGATFDRTYLENEVTYHVNFLSEIDSVLLPVSRDPRVRQLIASIRPTVAAHLALARDLQSSVAAAR